MRLKSTSLVAAAGALLLLVSCGGSTQPGSGSASADSPATIKIALPVSKMAFAQSDIAIAQDEGFFRREHLTVSTEGLQSGVQSVDAVVSGDAQIGGSSIEPVFSAGPSANLAIIGSYADRLPAVIEVQKGIDSASQLRGKKLGIQQVGAFREIMMRLVYERAGLTEKGITYVPVSSTAYIQALVAGEIDAAVLQDEQSIAAEQKDSNLHVLTDLYRLMPQYYYGTYFVSRSWLAQHQGVAKRFLTALVEAHRYIYQHRSKVVPQIAAATGFSDGVINQTYQRAIVKDGVFPVNEGLQQSSLEYTLKQDRKLGLLTHGTPDLSKLVDRAPIEAVVGQLGTWKGDPRWH